MRKRFDAKMTWLFLMAVLKLFFFFHKTTMETHVSHHEFHDHQPDVTTVFFYKEEDRIYSEDDGTACFLFTCDLNLFGI